MTDYDRNLDDLDTGFSPTLGGYVQHPNPHLEPDVPDYAQLLDDEPVDGHRADEGRYGEEPEWSSSPSAPGWQTAAYIPPPDVGQDPFLETSGSEPNYQEPAYNEPAYQEPVYHEPAYNEPAYQEAAYQEPAYNEPYQEPAYNEPAYQESAYNEPAYQQSAYQEPAYQEQQYESGSWGASHDSFDQPTPEFEETSWSLPTHPEQRVPALADPGSGEQDSDSKKSGLGASAFFIGFLCLAIVGLGGAAFFAFKIADRDPAGPATPEEAVAVMLEALAAEDALGVAESILPSERESLVDPALALVEELKRVGLLSADTDVSKISGVDITTNGLTMEIEEIDDQIRWVTLNGGTIVTSTSADGLPTSDSALALDVDETVDFSTDPVSFAVVEEAGSWYPSIWYTVAETARRAADLPKPTISRQPTGSRTPAEAVARFVTAASDMRPSEILVTLDPVEMRAAYDYSSLFISDLDLEALEVRRDLRADGSTWNLASLDTSVTDGGDKAIVSIDGFVLTGTQGLTDPFSVSLDAGCLTLEMTAETDKVCRGEDGFPDIPTNLRVVQRDGLWFVSAAPNLIYPYVDYLRTIETGSIQSFEELIESALESAFNPAELSLSEEAEPAQIWAGAFTVDQFIPAGTSAADMSDYLIFEDLPVDLVPGDAIVNLGQITGLEAAVDIEGGSVLTASMLRESANETEPAPENPDGDPEDPDAPAPTPTPAPSIAEPVEADLFPAEAVWTRVDSSTSAVFDINFEAREPLWVAERTDGSAVIQVTKLADSREVRALKFHEFFGWQKARNIEYPAYANSQYAVVVVGNYIVVSLDPLDDSGILLDQARYLGKQIR